MNLSNYLVEKINFNKLTSNYKQEISDKYVKILKNEQAI